MPTSRRNFLRQSACFAAGFAGIRALSNRAAHADSAAFSFDASPYGSLKTDPKGLLDLPEGFTYKLISRAGETMEDGLILPGKPDGMATFAGPNGTTLLLRNHELSPDQLGPFGTDNSLLANIDAKLLYDAGTKGTEAGAKPMLGGVSTLVFDTKSQSVVRQFLSLGGTIRNCAGGLTPWGSWISCEENVDRPGQTDSYSYEVAEDHGYAFEVKADAQPHLQQAKPLRSMGRFRREALAVDPDSGIVYQTEDMDDGAFYRFIPDEPGNLAAGGKLQALVIRNAKSLDTRNWSTTSCTTGNCLDVDWIDMDDVESPKDDLRYRAFKAGAARFARGEGIWWSDAAGWFACTTGGKAKLGQLWKYTPDSTNNGKLELFVEPNNTNMVHNADNLTVSPWGDLIVCEDRADPIVRLVGVTPQGELYTFANHHAGSEFAGACFSPDGSTLFVNIQHKGLTLAITGPWKAA